MAGARVAILAGSALLACASFSARAAPEQCYVPAASAEAGWLRFGSNGAAVGGKPEGNPGARFTVARAPDGTRAVQHTIRRGQEIHPLGADSPILYDGPVRAVRLTYSMWIEDGKSRGHPGKYFSLMGGRGQAGGHLENGPRGNRITNGEGWSYYLTHPVTDGSHGSASSRTGLGDAVGALNRRELGAECRGSRCFERLHGTSSSLPTGRWVEIGQTVELNDAGQSNGSASFSIDGRTVHTQGGVRFAENPATLPIWLRWRMMLGGTPEDLDPPAGMREWYTNFQLDVVPGGSTAAAGECAPPVSSVAPAPTLSPPGIPGDDSGSPIDELPLTAEVETDDACAIWICLPGLFVPSECDGAREEMFDRIFEGKSPVPSWGGCFGNSPPFSIVERPAAYMGDDVYIEDVACVHVGGGDFLPQGCLLTAIATQVFDHDGQPAGETHYRMATAWCDAEYLLSRGLTAEACERLQQPGEE